MATIDVLLFNGIINTMKDNNETASWVAVSEGKVLELGSNDNYHKYLTGANEVIDLKGKTVLPGFYDSHVNLVQTGLNLLSLNLSNAVSIDEVFELIRERTKTAPEGKIIRCIGFDELKLKEQRMPTRQELDSCAPDNPVWVNRIDYHTSIVNSVALHKLNLPFNLEGIQRSGSGLPNGHLTGRANAMVRNIIFGGLSDERRNEGVSKAVEIAIENGITSINAVEGGYTFHDMNAEYIYENNNTFPLDITLFYQTTDVDKIIAKGLKRIGGTIFLDGTFGSRTAALSSPYADDSSTSGILYFSQEEMNSFVLKAHKHNIQIAVHAIGDLAIEQILTAYEYAQEKYPRSNHRHRIEHFELPTEEHIARAQKLGLILSVQPAYEYYWGGENGMYETRLGQQRRRLTNPLIKYIQYGLVAAGGSDSDVTNMSPILGIHSAVNHPTGEYSISVLDAIRMFTINGARAIFEEDIKGSIETGKLGDMVILDKNPLEVPKHSIKDINVVGTIKEGNVLFLK